MTSHQRRPRKTTNKAMVLSSVFGGGAHYAEVRQFELLPQRHSSRIRVALTDAQGRQLTIALSKLTAFTLAEQLIRYVVSTGGERRLRPSGFDVTSAEAVR